MFYQVWLLNCGKILGMLGQYDNLECALKCVDENSYKYLPLDLEISITSTYNPYPSYCFDK